MPQKNDQNESLPDPIKLARTWLILSVLCFFGGLLLFLLSDSLTSLFIPNPNSNYEVRDSVQIKSIISISGGLAVLAGLASLLMYYLKHGLKLPPKEDLTNSASRERDKHAELYLTVENIKKQIKGIESKFSEETLILSPSEKNDALSILKDKLINTTAKDILQDIDDRYSVDVILNTQIKELRAHYKKTIDRIRAEIEALTRRGNLNLIIGSMTAILGLLILGYMVFSGQMYATAYVNDNSIDVIRTSVVRFTPRISLVILIEIFAYFFLKLYKSSLEGIKYFQNELTNIETKYVGFEGALLSKQVDSIKLAIDTLVKTERNFILKKGDSTVEVEKAKIDKNTLIEAIQAISGIASKASKSSKSED